MMSEDKSPGTKKAAKDDKDKKDKPKVAKPVSRGRTFSGGGVEKRG